MGSGDETRCFQSPTQLSTMKLIVGAVTEYFGVEQNYIVLSENMSMGYDLQCLLKEGMDVFSRVVILPKNMSLL